MKREEKVNLIINHFKAGEKKLSDFSLGMEVEHFVVDKDTNKSISYYGKDGVESTLDILSKGVGEDKKSYSPESKENILGFDKEKYSISIEPGAQLEVSINKRRDVTCLDAGYREAIAEINPILENKNQKLLAIGYRPKAHLSDVELIPRKRYRSMYEYFGVNGQEKSSGKGLGRNMMLMTASTQVSIDYSDELDFRKKYFLANALSPIFYAIADSVYLFEGKELEKFNKRAEIWYQTDRKRTGFFKGTIGNRREQTDEAFVPEFGYRQYAEAILDLSPIFDPRDGSDRSKDTLDSLLDQADEADFEWLIDHSLSIAFPDVRLKNFIEIRMMDSVPAPLCFSYACLIKGIFYGDRLDELCNRFKYLTDSALEGGIKSIIANGLEAYYFGDYVVNWAKNLIEIARENISEEEKKYLVPLENKIDELKTPRNDFEKIFKEKGVDQAYKAFEVRSDY